MSNFLRRNYVFLAMVCLALGLTSSLSAQVFLEDFNYTAGTNLTSNGWTAHSSAGTTPMIVGSSNLTFPTYSANPYGKSGVSLGNGEDINKSFGVITSGDVYTSFLLKIDTIGGAGYFFHLMDNTGSSNYRGRLFFQVDASNSNAYNLGLSFGNNTASYDTTEFALGSTILVVLKYSIVSGSLNNDSVSLYAFNSSGSFSTEPATALVGPLPAGTVLDIAPARVAFRQFNASTDLTVDAIRVNTSWNMTEPCLFTAPFFENFDGLALTSPYTALPGCWTPQVGPDYWDVTNDLVNTGHTYLPNIGDHTTGTANYMWIDASSDITANQMVTPMIDLSTLTAPYVGFWFASNNTTNNINHTIALDAWDGTAWVNLTSVSGNFSGWEKVAATVPSTIPDTTKFRIYAIANPSGTSSTYFYNDLGVDDFFIEEAPSCPQPNNLAATGITTSGATLSWTENGSATSWVIEYGASGFTPGSGTIVAASTNPYTLSSLSSNTAYQYYVQANCGNDSSAWSGPFGFSTLCNVYTVPYFEGFESGYSQAAPVAGCLSQASTTGTAVWSANTSLTTYNRTPFAGSWNAYLQYGNEDWIFIPISLTAGLSHTFEMYVRQDGAVATNSNMTVAYGASGTVAAMTNTIVATTGIINGNYQLLTGTFTPSTSGTYYVGIRGYMNGTPWYISLDNISIFLTPSCPAPSALAASNITANSAQLSWTENGSATSWQIEYGPAGFTQGSGTVVSTSSNPYTLSGLTFETNYSFYVSSSCGSSNSTFSAPASFFTGYCTPAPTSVDGTGITNVSMDTVNNTTGAEPGNYGNYSYLVAEATQGTNLNISITLATGYTYDMWAWIDWNNDLDFSDPGEEFFLGTSSSTNPTVFTSSIAIPSNAPLGNHRIRIGGADSGLGTTSPSNPCYSSAYAAFEDYTINVVIQPPFDGAVAAIIVDQNVCSSNDTIQVVLYNNGSAALSNFNYYTSLNGATATMSTYSGSLAVGTSDTVSVPVVYTLGTNSFVAYTSVSGDVNASNDTLSASTYYGDYSVLVNVEVSTSWPEEIFWYLLTTSGDTVVSVAPNTYTNNTSNYMSVCLASTDTFEFQAWDSYGDGWDNSSYAIYICDTNGVLIDNAGNSVSNGTSGSGTAQLEVSETFYIPSAITYTASVNDVLCFGQATGDATVAGSGGITPFEILWSNGSMDLMLDSVGAGTYTYVLADSTGCFVTDSITITQPSDLFSTISGIDVLCPENMNGLAAVVVDSGAVAPYTYQWNDAASTTTNTVQNLGVGNYSVTITDANGCEFVDSIAIASVNSSPSVSISGNDTICGDASSTLDAGSGFSNYAWSNNGQGQTINVTTSGTYSVTITDTNGCTADDAFDVFAYNLITLTTSGVDVTCEGGSDGVVAATATGGTSTFNYEWNDGTMASANIDVEAGTYYVTVVDGSGCTVEDSITIGFLHAAPSFSFDPNSIGGEGSATINAGGSFSEYEWSNGASTSEITVTTSGAYVCTVTDTNGCTATDTINVEIWPLGINQTEATSLSVYPNPSSGIFNLNMTNVPVDQVEVMVYNINGQVISTSTFSASNGNVINVVDLSNAASGIYLMQLNINGNITTVRLNVQ